MKIRIKRVRKRKQERRTSNERREDSETEVKDRKAKQAVSLRSGGESQCSHMEPRTRSMLPTADHQTPRILLESTIQHEVHSRWEEMPMT